MESKIPITRSLPPLVEGKIHGYLKFVIDEIVWIRRCPGNILIIVPWWGEVDNAQFRHGPRKDEEHSSKKNLIDIYAIKTNFDLFKEYVRNADGIELLIVLEKSQHIVGTAQITKLLNIFSGKSFSQSCPIINTIGCKIGDIHIRINLTPIANPKSPQKDLKKKPSNVLKTTTPKPPLEFRPIPSSIQTMDCHGAKYELNRKMDKISLKLKRIQDLNMDDNVYRSILKDRTDLSNLTPKNSVEITDKLVAQVVDRARKLREEMSGMKAKVNDDLLIDDNLTVDSFRSSESAEREAALYEYFIGKDMSLRSEKHALETLRTYSPTPSLIELAAETIRSCKENSDPVDKKQIYPYDNPQPNVEDSEGSDTNRICLQSKKACPLDYVDSARIVVDSLILTSAGYRRVKSSCISRADGLPLSVTYFVQYDTLFVNIKNLNKQNKKIVSGTKPVKMCSKQQNGLIVFFNHEGVYDLSKQYLHMDMPLKFKIYHRHINQRTPTELGIGSMYISDASKSSFLSSTQKVAIIKKGIKIGDLKVKVELGCDRIHFGKQYVEAVTSAKENIPVLELSSQSSSNENTLQRYKTYTGSELKSSNKANVSSNTQEKPRTSSNSLQIHKNTHHKKNNGLTLKTQTPGNSEEKILLHGLIYIGDGKDLPEMNTYLICRAFWKEDRSISRVCNSTANPFYHFHQLVPLIHGPELLERTKDNCIITEVYSKHSGRDDRLIGIAKLSVHQLYVAFRDPLVLPHLLKSKYPVISVDGWVSITDPISGALRGQLCALVALGTADQIALLEMTRGLRDISQSNRNNHDSNRNTYLHEEVEKNDSEAEHSNKDEREKKSQECQTEITTLNDFKRQISGESHCNREDSAVLHTIVDRLAQALSVPRNIADQEAQTELDFPPFDHRDRIKGCSIEPLCLDGINSNYSVESSNGSPRDNFNMPREIFRSVGVGAEFDEEAHPASNNQAYNAQNNDHVAGTSFQSDSNPRDFDEADRDDSYDYEPKSAEINTLDDNTTEKGFNAIVEIYCALHLPKIEKNGQLVEPCTYVTFQKFRNNTNNRIDAYMTTDVCPFSCNPKYDWRSETKLSTDLLIKEDKKLIMKVWRLIDPDISMEVNIEKDVVMGSASLDLSVLTLGFPVVSGWFHIIDCTEKCNGQLKVSVTPLDNISIVGKSVAITSRIPAVSHSHQSTGTYSNEYQKTNKPNQDKRQDGEINGGKSEIEGEPMIDIGLNLGDASMSFLSQSLKQKLSELDEIKQRLQSRLHDVTNTAFDDFENDFDIDHEDDEKNGNEADIQESAPWLNQPLDNHSTHSERNTESVTNGNRCSDNEHAYLAQSSSENNTSTIETIPDTGYSSSSHNHSSQNLTNGNTQDPNNFHRSSRTNLINYQTYQTNLTVHNYKNDEMRHFNSTPSSVSVSDNQFNEANYPIRGTRMHINHLLDKLSTQLTSAPPPITNLPMKRNIMELISSLRRNNNNFSNVKCNREANVRTVPTQTDYPDSRPNNSHFHQRDIGKDEEIPAKTQKRDKISSAIRDELIADDHNDTTDYDYLSSHLMASNVRHMGLDGMNPLLYPHMIPEISISESESEGRQVIEESSPTFTPEGEAVERLDSRYVESFNATINKGLDRLRDQSRTESTSGTVPSYSQESMENAGVFRVTPSGVSENIDGNIDVTVIHKPCSDDLMASNSVETTTTSLDNNTQTPTEIDDNSSLNSSDTSVFVVSRQAPDGGNPIEDVNRSIIAKQNNPSSDSSSTES